MLEKLRQIRKEIREIRTIVKNLEGSNAELKKQLEKNNKELKKFRKDLDFKMREMADPQLYEHLLKEWYINRTGNVLDLEDPKGYNEKIQWMKLYDNDPRKVVLSDKYLVRDWVRDKIGEEYLIPLLGVYQRAEQIDFDALPDQFVLKANHGSQWVRIVRDKEKENLKALRKEAGTWLKTSFAFRNGYELHYRDIPRRLIIEKYIENVDGDMPDYKFWCFDGEVKFIQVVIGRKDGAHTAFFDTKWNRMSFSTGFLPPITEEVRKPEQLEKMIELANTLSEKFVHVRVDLYLLDNGEIKFGEMTFTPASGANKWDPPEADRMIGDMMRLPQTHAGQ